MIKLAGPNWEIKNIQAILFDKDGTIIDVHKYWGAIIKKRSRALIKFLDLKKEFYPKICLAMGFNVVNKKLLPQGPVALVSREEVINSLLVFFKNNEIKISEAEIIVIFLKVHEEFLKNIFKYVKILPGVKKILKDIKSNKIKTALITSDSTQAAKKIITHLKLDNYFDLIVGRELTPSSKSTGLPAKLVCETLKVNPGKTVCVGDAPMDISMAKQADLKACVGVATGQTPYLELNKQTKYSIKSFKDLTVR